MKIQKICWVLMAPAVLFLASCEQPGAHDGAAELNMDSVKMKIEAIEAAYEAASNNDDVDGVAAYYASDAISYAPDEPGRNGMDAIKAGIKKDIESDTTGATLDIASTGIWAAGNYATETGTWTVMDKEGKKAGSGTFITLFELRDGKYQAIRDIWNSDSPDEAAPEAVPAP